MIAMHSKKRLPVSKQNSLQTKSSQMHNILGVCLRAHTLIEKMLQCAIFLYFELLTLTEHMHKQPFGITAQKQLQLKHSIASCQE